MNVHNCQDNCQEPIKAAVNHIIMGLLLPLKSLALTFAKKIKDEQKRPISAVRIGECGSGDQSYFINHTERKNGVILT